MTVILGNCDSCDCPVILGNCDFGDCTVILGNGDFNGGNYEDCCRRNFRAFMAF